MNTRSKSLVALSLVSALHWSVVVLTGPQTHAAESVAITPSTDRGPVPIDLAANPRALTNAPDAYRPKMRWWWPEGEVSHAQLRRELDAIKAAGFGGVEQVLLHNPLDWEGDAFRAATAAAIRHANAIGLEFDVTAGPGWPVSGPSVDDPAKDLSMQDLHYGSRDLVGPSVYTGPVPDNPPGTSQRRTLVAVTAAKVVERTADAVVLDPESAVDLTSTVKGGNITWSVPAGTWKLFGLWMRPSGQRAVMGEGRLVVDHFNADALNAVLGDLDRLVLDPLDSELRKNGGFFFEDSYEVEHGEAAFQQTAAFWTPAMLREFEKRRGYSISRFLPAIFEEIDMSGGAGERVTNDYQLTLTDLLIDEHLKPMATWAASHGMEMRNQAYMAGVGELGTRDNTRLARHAQNPDVETLGFGDPELLSAAPGVGAGPVVPGTPVSREVIERYRYITSGAHLSGAEQVSNELGATFLGAYAQRPQDYKELADRSFAAGVTTPIVHGYAYALYNPSNGTDDSSWPGWCAWCGTFQIADSWNENWPQMKAWRSLTAYWTRASALMRNGKPTVDFTILEPSSAVTGIDVEVTPAPADPLRRVLHRKGYSWDHIDPVSIRGTGPVVDKKLLPNGPAYRAVVVDHGAAIPGATAQRVLKLARQGLPVVVLGEVPNRGTSYKSSRAEDTAVRTAFRRLRTLANVRFARSAQDLTSALAALKVQPAVKTFGGAEIVPVRRRTPGGDVWFLYNNSTTKKSVDLSFASVGQPHEIDLWSGKAQRLAEYSTRNGRTRLDVTLPPAGTTVISFNRRAAEARHLLKTEADEAVIRGSRIVIRDMDGGAITSRLSDGRTIETKVPRLPAPIPLSQPFDVTARIVGPAGNDTVSVTMPEPVDWRRVPALARESGVGNYRTSIVVPRPWLTTTRRVAIDFGGEVGGTLAMWVNGKRVRIPSVPDEPVDITRMLVAGRNSFRFEVATNLINKMQALSTTGNPDYLQYAVRETQPYGLLRAPVLRPVAEVKIAATERRAATSGSRGR